jgi:threonine dehydrogenase-like Zn-dependent dehydrogenase
MRGAVLYGPREVRIDDRPDPRIVDPTDAVIRLSATCICGSDLWPYRGLNAASEPAPMGHEYCGIVEEVGRAVTSIKPGQFVIGSFAASDNTCPHCRAGYQTSLRASAVGHRGAGAFPPRADGRRDAGRDAGTSVCA